MRVIVSYYVAGWRRREANRINHFLIICIFIVELKSRHKWSIGLLAHLMCLHTLWCKIWWSWAASEWINQAQRFESDLQENSLFTIKSTHFSSCLNYAFNSRSARIPAISLCTFQTQGSSTLCILLRHHCYCTHPGEIRGALCYVSDAINCALEWWIGNGH